jgi:hypothetical protein
MNRTMRARDWFTVGFRLFGVWMILEGVGYLVSGLELQFRLVDPARSSPGAYFLRAAIDAVVAVVLLRSKIRFIWSDPDPDDPAFEVVMPVEDSNSSTTENNA